ncbi:MAG TPA: ABC transporter permease [Candidatus Desulfofervidus auxilii]|uniref:ABC transporter permease n=1 Tax=Desulfofervidus auxilii TaxID=1621989 RepID=A0A7C0Y2C5_DESA2|nr:ABC transporter permease [Candidatus Desulfofervidus auxilii]
MFKFSLLTIKSLLKDRIFIIILSLCFLFFSVPVFSSFSMRQVQEVGITMSLTLNSFILLLLSIFGGMATVWRDIEKKSIYSLLSYPINRSQYLLGRFMGCVILLLMISVINFFLSAIVIKICASMYKSRLPILWENISFAFLFTFFKYILLLAIGFLCISFSTSFFTPFFLTIAIYIAGNASQGIYEYVLNEAAKKYPFWFKDIIKTIYYFLPNFSAFDFTAHASYALKMSYKSLLFTSFYFLSYFLIIISLACIIFSRRDML